MIINYVSKYEFVCQTCQKEPQWPPTNRLGRKIKIII